MSLAEHSPAFRILLPVSRASNREGWVEITGSDGEGAFPSFEAAAAFAAERFPAREVVIGHCEAAEA
jgi:hypothetical protein